LELAEKVEGDLAKTVRHMTTTREEPYEIDLLDEDLPSWSRNRQTHNLFKFAERIESEIADALKQYTIGE